MYVAYVHVYVCMLRLCFVLGTSSGVLKSSYKQLYVLENVLKYPLGKFNVKYIDPFIKYT